MSHLHERSEKKCLNCGAELYDRFCHKCGQENVEPKQTFWQLTLHFFEDLTHFDGKFFTTIKYLLFKPGFLTEEYVKGRRASHINPIRMYLFISAVYFLLFMTFFLPGNGSSIIEFKNSTRDTVRAELQRGVVSSNGSVVKIDSAGGHITTRDNKTAHLESESDWIPEETAAEYDSSQHALPKEKRDWWFKHYVKRKLALASALYERDSEEFGHRLSEKFYHTLPTMLFLSLPLVALLLRLLYIRRRQFYYVSHVIFVIHTYCFAFILLIFIKTFKNAGSFGEDIALILLLGFWVYLFMAMKRFYKQGWAKTFIKFFIFASLGSFIIGLLTVLFGFNSLLNTAG